VLNRIRRRLASATPPREELVAEHAPGRSFADIGCMWKVNGAIAFAAEAAGAIEVAGMDVMAPTPEYEAEHARRASRVRFVEGDLHDPAALAELGTHEVVWCSGVIYHAPHPLLTLERLRSITGSALLLATEVIPEIRRHPRACIFAPPPGIHPAHTQPFDPAQGYGNWYWGITRSALLAMLEATGFAIANEHRTPFHTTVVAYPA
jgi:2-polyprenyl-3-methyl-5-hydroxy-6-metoxy-1,4-benzoquinol methylase